MAQIEAEANTSKGRGKRGGRSTRARESRGRGRISNSSQEAEDTEEMIVQRKKKSTDDIAQVDITNSNMSLVADTNLEVKADPDAVNLIADFDTDEKVIKVLNESTLDEQERIDRRKADQACSDYEQRILNSRRELWQKIRGKIHDLSIGYAPFSKKDKRWKDVYIFSYPKEFKHIEFVSARLRDSISEQEDIDKSIKKPSWKEHNEKLKLIKTRTRGGIDHPGMETLRSDLLDIDIMTDNLGERITPSHLEKVEAVKIVYRKINFGDVREEFLYFLRDGCTPLHWAAIRGNLEACTVLVQAGKKEDLVVTDNTGLAPAQLAIFKGTHY
ncbi:hypothetical protein AgCh_030861 [Apium graveolens]